MNTNRNARPVTSALAACVLSLAAAPAASAQTPQQREAPATVAGRVTTEGRGLAGIPVGLLPSEPGPGFRPLALAKTDAEGFYKIPGLAPGRYRVMPSAPAYVVSGLAMGRGWPPGTSVMLVAGETVEDLNFTLERGGVITGRVTDADGQPVSGETVRLMPLEESAQGRLPFGSQMWRTDDRGIYRLYGLPAGRYKVSVGVEPNRGFAGFGRSERGYYARTYHPDTTDEARARVVEVSAGGEMTDVDITLGRLSKSYKARGRVVEATTGQPVAGVTFGYEAIDPATRRMLVSGGGMRSQTNARGEFEIAGLLPGTYAAFASPDGTVGLYSDNVPFEIKDSDVSGLEVKLHAGASLSGVVTVEGTAERALVAQLVQQLRLYPRSDPPGLTPERFESVPVSPDGSFHINGLRPGRVSIATGYPPVKGFSLARVELNGAEQREGIEVAEGAHVTGVRLVFVYGTGKVRGQVVLRNGEQPATLPPGARLSVFARRPGTSDTLGTRSAEVDARGRFLIEGLPAGEVELTVNLFGPRTRAHSRQLVNVSDGGEASVTLTLDVSQNMPPPPRRENP